MPGDMTGDEFDSAVRALGLTVTGTNSAQSFLDIGERTARRWAVDGPPRAVALLLRWMLAERRKPERILDLYGQTRPRAKGTKA